MTLQYWIVLLSIVKMKISELSRESGVPVATVKFYLREGLLPPGRRTAATQADYGPEHLTRLRIIRTLVETAGLSLTSVRKVLDALESPDVPGAIATAHDALMPATERPTEDARRVVERLGWTVAPDSSALQELAAALDAIAAVGLDVDDDKLATYAAAAEQVAAADVASVPTGPAEDAVAHVVLGTVLFEPLLLSLRKLAHQSISRRAWAAQRHDRA